MNYFDILLAKKLSGGSPTPPGDTYERKSVTSYPVTDSANYPLPKCDVTVTDADKCEVIVTTDNTISEDSGVYIERQSGGGNRELDAIVGGSVVWNQLVKNGNFSTNTDWAVYNNTKASLSIADNSATVTFLDSGSRYQFGIKQTTMTSYIKDHKYLLFAELKASKTGIYGFDMNGTTTNKVFTITSVNTWISSCGVFNATASNTNSIIFEPIDAISENDTMSIRNFYCTDLTAVFGITIADYIYSLEQATAGSGIAWLKSYGYLTEDYYGYTANKIESVSVARHVTKDSNDSVIGSYAINPITLRGIPKLNASNQLYYDGDRYEASGRVTRKYGVVDLGTLTWNHASSNRSISNAIANTIKKPATQTSLANLLTSNIYTQVSSRTSLDTNGQFAILQDGEMIFYYDGVNEPKGYMVYEKATPTTESTSPFEPNQIVDANGTEEYIDAGVEAGTRDVAIPVGHETKYFNGKAYVKPLTAGTSDTISMADMGIMPTSPMYISANGEINAEYWKQVE